MVKLNRVKRVSLVNIIYFHYFDDCSTMIFEVAVAQSLPIRPLCFSFDCRNTLLAPYI